MPRFDHVGVIVGDLDAAAAFFVSLGFEQEGRWDFEGEAVGRIIGLEGVRGEAAMVRAPDGSGKLELIRYDSPADADGPHPWPANRPGFRHVAIEIDGLDATVDRLREDGFDLVGEVIDYGDSYRLCYVRGPEGLIVELAQRLGSEKEG